LKFLQPTLACFRFCYGHWLNSELGQAVLYVWRHTELQVGAEILNFNQMRDLILLF